MSTAPSPQNLRFASPRTIQRPGWRLRPVLASDAPILHRRCMPDSDDARVQRMLNRAQKAAVNRRGLGLVAETPTGDLIAFGQLTQWPRAAEISDLIVAADWRGQGIGSAIIRKLIVAAQEMAMDRVEIGVALANYHALRLYRRLGFEYGRTLDLDLGSGPEPVMFLWMTLNGVSPSLE